MNKFIGAMLVSAVLLVAYLMGLHGFLIISYVSIGFTLYLIFFLCAKIKKLDDKYPSWDHILNSLRGISYFVLLGCLLWLPVLLTIFREMRILRKEKQKIQETKSSWLDDFKDPSKLHQAWFNRFYQ